MDKVKELFKVDGKSYNSLSWKRVLLAVVIVLLIVAFILTLVGALDGYEPAKQLRQKIREAYTEKPWKPQENYTEKPWKPQERFTLPEVKETKWKPMEHMSGEESSPVVPNETKQIMTALGYVGPDSSTWEEVIKVSELEPSTFTNHQDFVKDVRRFSSGANFTSVTDDNNNWSFTQFIGLQRPQHVDIGESSRQQPDVDQSVLKRNGQLRFGSNTADFDLAMYAPPSALGNYESKVQNAEQFVNW
jgi:hypothetical protein